MRLIQRSDRPLRSALLLLALPALAACSESGAETAVPPPAERLAQVRTLALEPRAVIDRASLPADLMPRRRATLAAEVGGTVESVAGEIGQAVAAGRVLATIDERVYAQQVAEAEALLRQALQQHERARNLFERKAVTKVILLDAETGRDVAEARLASARLQLDKARVRAPWAGRIAARRVDAGDFVAPGTPLFELVDSSRLKVRAPARAADVPFLVVGREVEVRVDAYPGEVFRARVERLGAELDPASRTLDVEAEIANPDGRLRPGLPARLEVPRRELAGALVVPSSAVLDLGETKAVYVVVEGRAARRAVTLGPVIGEEVVIEGLERGARVVIEGQHAIADGQAVEEV
jgi:membrane fusion protein (multidrug efflux system)